MFAALSSFKCTEVSLFANVVLLLQGLWLPWSPWHKRTSGTSSTSSSAQSLHLCSFAGIQTKIQFAMDYVACSPAFILSTHTCKDIKATRPAGLQNRSWRAHGIVCNLRPKPEAVQSFMSFMTFAWNKRFKHKRKCGEFSFRKPSLMLRKRNPQRPLLGE